MTSAPPPGLPPLTAPEAEHSQRLRTLIREHILAAGGFLDFEAFMQLALYAPGLGYYSAGSTKLGRAGDFVTAPEVSDLFSRCVARQCAEILHAGAGGDIVEFGAGSGRMAAVVLEELAALGALPRRYLIVEVSAELKARQRERIDALPAPLRERVSWLTEWPVRQLAGIVLANEVLDALPVQRFVIRGGRPQALGVALAPEGVLVEAERAAGPALAAAYETLRAQLPDALPEGYVSEICLTVAPWVQGVADSLERGVALLFDYGLPRAHYYHPQRIAGTLRCHFRHRAHEDPLRNVGLQDITAWVDFTRVAEAAVEGGLEVIGFATQAAFLLGAGLEGLLGAPGSSERARRAGEARQLLLPGLMGEAFKVMALARGCEAPLLAFAHQDLRHQL